MKSIRHFLPLLAVVSPLVFASEPVKYLYEEIIVTSSRIEQPLRRVATSVTVITREDLDLKGYNSVADVLRTEASIAVSNSGGAGKATSLRIRGEEGFRTLVLIDGVDVADPTGTQIGPQIQNISNSHDIERIEVLRGPQGFLYGADAGGIVNIISQRGSGALSGGLSLEAGSYGTQNLGGRVSGGNDIVDYSFAITNSETDGFNSRVSDALLQDDDGGENTTVHLTSGWAFTENLKADIVYRNVDTEFGFDNCSTASYASTNDCTGNSEQENVKLGLEYINDQVIHRLSYAFTDVGRENLSDNARRFFTKGETRELEYLGTYPVSATQKLIFGADYEEDEITATGSETERDQLGIFAEYQQSIADDLFLTAGLRRDDNSEFGTHMSYRASAAYIQELSEGTLKYRATYGTGFRAPSLSEQAYNDGPSAFGSAASFQLSEEESKGFDIGLDYITASQFSVQITYFDQQIENEILFDLVNFSGYLQPSTGSGSKGVELELGYPINSQLEVLFNATYNDTENADNLTRIRRPEQLANLSLNYLVLDDRLSVLANLRISRNSENEIFRVGRVPLDDYKVIDISTNYSLREGIELFARIENLADEKYQEITGFNTAERSGYAGVRFKF